MVRNVIDIEVLKDKNLTKSYREVKRKDIPKYLKAELIRNTLKNIKNSRDHVLIRFLWMTGVRITEALKVKVGHIDFDQQTVVINHLKSRKWKRRTIPLHHKLVSMLLIYTAAMNKDKLLFDFTRQRADQIVKKYFGSGVSCHMFRDTFAVHYMQSGGELYKLQRLLGHSHITTTTKYLKIVPEDLRDKLDEVEF